MLAAVLHGAHDLRIEARETPEPGLGEIAVRVSAGGICGSDLSYYNKGRVGDFAVREPLTLGHEVSGTVATLGAGVDGPAVGTLVAINPSRPCLRCDYCRSGRSNLCRDMRFLGSAARSPHVQGAFSEIVVLRADQCVPVPPGTDPRVAACAEPLAVALHAISRAGVVFGVNALVAGAGPIGQLVALGLHAAGAARVTITDIADEPLGIARAAGAHAVINVAKDPGALDRAEKFDVAFECTGVASVLGDVIRAARPGGRVIQLGMLPPGGVTVPVNLLMAREIDLLGSFRFHTAFDQAVTALASGRIDVTPILSGTRPLADANAAFALAGDRTRAIKVHLTFD